MLRLLLVFWACAPDAPVTQDAPPPGTPPEPEPFRVLDMHLAFDFDLLDPEFDSEGDQVLSLDPSFTRTIS